MLNREVVNARNLTCPFENLSLTRIRIDYEEVILQKSLLISATSYILVAICHASYSGYLCFPSTACNVQTMGEKEKICFLRTDFFSSNYHACIDLYPCLDIASCRI
jgi:hypothetical protein